MLHASCSKIEAYMQFLAARSLCTIFIFAKYSIPLAIWRHISISCLLVVLACIIYISITNIIDSYELDRACYTNLALFLSMMNCFSLREIMPVGVTWSSSISWWTPNQESLLKSIIIIIILAMFWVIGASLSEPHTNQYYEKIAVLMYVCMYGSF